MSGKTYPVRAQPWKHGWELHIPGVGVSQSRSLGDAEMMARDLISSYEGIPADTFSVTITPDLGDELGEQVHAARRASDEAGLAQRRAAAQARAAVRSLRQAGLSGRDIAQLLGVSPQRISQLLQPATPQGSPAPVRAAADPQSPPRP